MKRHFSFRIALMAGIASSSMISVQAYSQEADTASTGTAERTSSGGLEEIVVTAQRRKERQQDVPVSITSVSGKTLENSGFQSVTDLQFLVPGVQFNPNSGGVFQIRGTGSGAFDYSTERAVSLVVDDVVMDAPRDLGLTGFADIQQIDVLKGPQGTMFGKNATSGVIAVTTGQPALERFSANGYLSYGERDDRNATLTLNVPLGEQLALRVSGFSQGQEGYGRYTTLNQPLNSFKEYGYRAKLLFQPNDHVEINYSNDYAHHWDNFIRTSVSGAPPAVTALQIANGVTPGPKNDDNADSKFGYTRNSSWGHSLRTQIEIGDDTLTLVTAYRGTSYVGEAPANLVPADKFAFLPYNKGTVSSRKFSQELRWASPTGGFVEYLAGVFYNRLHTKSTQIQWATLSQPLESPTGVPLTTFYTLTGAQGQPGNRSLFNAINTNIAAFGQIKFNFTPQLSLDLSGRYSHDNNSQEVGLDWLDPLPITGVNATFIPLYAAPTQTFGRVKGDHFTYRIAGQYKFDQDAMAYVTYATGYKPGGAAFVVNTYSPYGAETVKSIEVGVKSELFDRRVRLNLDLFRSIFSDFQTSLIAFGPGSGIPQAVIGNAGKLRSQGVEGDLVWRVTDALTLNGGLTYTDAKYTNYQYNSGTNYAGTVLANAPKWQGSVSAVYDGEINDNLRLRANLDYAYRSEAWSATGQPAYSRIPGYGIVNTRISLSPTDHNIEVGVYVRNLFDKYYSTAFQQYSTLALLHYVTRDAHRTVGAFARFSF